LFAIGSTGEEVTPQELSIKNIKTHFHKELGVDKKTFAEDNKSTRLA
jgi:hypothetical protein